MPYSSRLRANDHLKIVTTLPSECWFKTTARLCDRTAHHDVTNWPHPPPTPPLSGYKPITPHPSPLFLTSLMGLYQVRSAEAHYVNLQMDKQLRNALTFGTVHGMVLWKAIHPASVSAQTPSPHTPVDSESIHPQIICPSSCRLAWCNEWNKLPTKNKQTNKQTTTPSPYKWILQI